MAVSKVDYPRVREPVVPEFVEFLAYAIPNSDRFWRAVAKSSLWSEFEARFGLSKGEAPTPIAKRYPYGTRLRYEDGATRTLVLMTKGSMFVEAEIGWVVPGREELVHPSEVTDFTGVEFSWHGLPASRAEARPVVVASDLVPALRGRLYLSPTLEESTSATIEVEGVEALHDDDLDLLVECLERAQQSWRGSPIHSVGMSASVSRDGNAEISIDLGYTEEAGLKHLLESLSTCSVEIKRINVF